jgi:PAS domain S-box-containing protein
MPTQTSQDLLARIAELELRLEESEETLRAIRTGEVDALVVAGPEGEKVFTLEGADHPYRVLVQEMHEGTVTLDPDGLILYSNPQFAAMVGWPVEKVMGARLERFLPSDERSMFAALFAGALRDRSRGEISLLAADGRRVPAYVSLNRLAAGSQDNVCVVITDLTEQRRGEAMIAAEQLSRSILEQAAEAVVVIDAKGKILRASDTANRLAGKNVLLQDFDSAFRLVSPARTGESNVAADGIDAQRLVAAARSEEVLRGMELTLESPNGGTCTVLLSAGPLWNGTHELLGCVVTLTDITHRKQAEEALGRQSQALARSNADLQQFAYVTSHDLQEPLRTIASYAQLLKRRYEKELGSDADEFIEFIVSGVQRMKSLIDALLSFSRVVNVETPPFAPVEMEGALQWASMNLQIIIEESKAQVTHDKLPTDSGDQVMLVQLFQNLISNSIKYRSKQAPAIHVSAERQDEGWVFSVRDNGIGIDPQYHERIFGVFKRLHGREIPGTGIGLAICQRILQKHGGQIWVDSQLGAGSVFKFTLPVDPDLT